MGVVDALTEWRAHRWLTALRDGFATEGLAVAALVPGLGAAVDQHAAAVRDILLLGVPGVDRGVADVEAPAQPGHVLLAGYGSGLLDGAGVALDEVAARVAGRWPRAAPLAVRLLAVAALSRGLDPDR